MGNGGGPHSQRGRKSRAGADSCFFIFIFFFFSAESVREWEKKKKETVGVGRGKDYSVSSIFQCLQFSCPIKVCVCVYIYILYRVSLLREMSNSRNRKGRKELNLDYSYGEESDVLGNGGAAGEGTANEGTGLDNEEDKDIIMKEIEENDELIIGSSKAMADKKHKDKANLNKAKNKQREKMKNSKYLGYEDLVNGYDKNGYKFDESDDFEKLDYKGWNLIIGYILIRIVSPVILIFHAVVIGLVLWKVYNFDFSPDSEIARLNCMPYITGCLSLNAFFVHWVSKYLFKSNYYKPRPKQQRPVAR